ncbi:hypothetical protein RvY_12245 [Ramazzottius varieornatus]|uniref:Uncharacterized protein n=1 Tax=Ramazzottius varieornatus TaxID=947166 RepID=A0A1D1VSL9_RAMVA|nr:hypothetical protein RvY_12245 [Ramazzottius varieornatus]
MPVKLQFYDQWYEIQCDVGKELRLFLHRAIPFIRNSDRNLHGEADALIEWRYQTWMGSGSRTPVPSDFLRNTLLRDAPNNAGISYFAWTSKPGYLQCYVRALMPHNRQPTLEPVYHHPHVILLISQRE